MKLEKETALYNRDAIKDDIQELESKIGDSPQYFWHTETDTGAGAGAHITKKPQEDFLDDPAHGGGNLLAQSDGIYVRDGLQEVAKFGADGAQIGSDSGTKNNAAISVDLFAVRKGTEAVAALGGGQYAIQTGDNLSNEYTFNIDFAVDGPNLGGSIYLDTYYMSEVFGGIDWSGFEFGWEILNSGGDVLDYDTFEIPAYNPTNRFAEITRVSYSGTMAGAATFKVTSLTTALIDWFADVKSTALTFTADVVAQYDTLEIDITSDDQWAFSFAGTGIQRGGNFTVDWSGNIDMAGMLKFFFNIVDLDVAVGQVAAHAQSNIGTVTVPTADQPDGMTLVGIVGVACNNYRVVPYNYYVNGAHSITCAVVNTTTANSAAGTTMTFKLLYAKMASA